MNEDGHRELDYQDGEDAREHLEQAMADHGRSSSTAPKVGGAGSSPAGGAMWTKGETWNPSVGRYYRIASDGHAVDLHLSDNWKGLGQDIHRELGRGAWARCRKHAVGLESPAGGAAGEPAEQSRSPRCAIQETAATEFSEWFDRFIHRHALTAAEIIEILCREAAMMANSCILRERVR